MPSIIVRSIATGSPVNPLFGVEPTGNSFAMMSIDIHSVEEDLITQSYRVEEWKQAIRQLTEQSHTLKPVSYSDCPIFSLLAKKAQDC